MTSPRDHTIAGVAQQNWAVKKRGGHSLSKKSTRVERQAGPLFTLFPLPDSSGYSTDLGDIVGGDPVLARKISAAKRASQERRGGAGAPRRSSADKFAARRNERLATLAAAGFDIRLPRRPRSERPMPAAQPAPPPQYLVHSNWNHGGTPPAPPPPPVVNYVSALVAHVSAQKKERVVAGVITPPATPTMSRLATPDLEDKTPGLFCACCADGAHGKMTIVSQAVNALVEDAATRLADLAVNEMEMDVDIAGLESVY